MKLLGLEIIGFKSFAEKTRIDFSKGINAIVGPNGSGKSNIIEAIRWVMGESSAKSLRGDKMADVIFSGTSSRKPVNIAEVSMFIDNSDHFLNTDFEELTISRRMNRDGQSDYFINNHQVRLKDITELFMDTGLGKESFSIISQGQVEEIFNSKPTDRRGIFEEAAGVVKYKTRKKEAQAKLEDTADNLDRVEDIIYEIEQQVHQLKSESEKAKDYLDKRDKLRLLDVAVMTRDIGLINDHLKKDLAEAEEIGLKLDLMTKQIHQDEGKIHQEKITQAEARQALDTLQDQLVTTVQTIESKRGSLDIVDEKQRHAEDLKIQHEKRLQALDMEAQEWSKKKEATEESLAQKDAEVQEIKDQMSRLDASINQLKSQSPQALEDLRSEYLELMQAQTSLENDIQYAKKQEKASQVQEEKAKDHLTSLREDEEAAQAQLDDLEKASAQLKTDLESLVDQSQKLQGDMDKAEEALEKQRLYLQEESQDLQTLQAQIRSLKNMQASYSGYYQGVQTVMKASDQLDGIVGTVAELLKVEAPYQVAIDTALASTAQFIIVQKDVDGQRAIRYLNENRGGRATFMPLETIKARSVPQETLRRLEGQAGFIGIASQLVAYAPEIEPVVENLLGQVLVAEDLKTATGLSKLAGGRHKVVTLDGDVVNVGGSLTGGKTKGKRQSLLGQNLELDQLTADEKDKASLYQDHLKEHEEAVSRLSLLKKQQDERSASVQDLQAKRQENKYEAEKIQERLASIKRQAKAYLYEEKNHQEDRLAYQEEADTKSKDLLANQEKIKDLQGLIDNHQKTSTTNEEKLSLLEAEKAEYQEMYSEKRQDQAAFKRDLALYEEQIQTLAQEKQAEEETYKESQAALDQLADKDSLQEDLHNEQVAKEALEEKIQELQETYSASSQHLSNLEERLVKGRSDRDKLKDQKAKLDIQTTRRDEKLSQLLSSLNENYKLTYEAARKEAKALEDYEEARQQVKSLKENIKRLGPVNVQAIEDYEKLKERFDFMDKQRQDLLSAKDDLLTTMDEMDEEVAHRFKETYDQIQAEFQVVFPRMFGGGKARLELTDPDNLLETGVEIKAQPPGKNLQSLKLLSGGEKALTALALLFAIIQTRPIPFVILDEVEAALDDANVLRFGQYLQSFEKEDIQFIVITHRKGTMEHADTLYGVVMQEPGISSLVSVRLSDVDEILNTENEDDIHESI